MEAERHTQHIEILEQIARDEKAPRPARISAIKTIEQIKERQAGRLVGDLYEMTRSEIQAEIARTKGLIDAKPLKRKAKSHP